MDTSPEQNTPAPPAPDVNQADVKVIPPKRGHAMRFLLMASLPVLLVAGGAYFYVSGGRIVSTEDSYVSQEIVRVMPEVSGKIISIGPGENDIVSKGTLLFSIDDAVYANTVAQAEAAVASARLDIEELKAAYRKAEAQLGTAREALAIAQTRHQRQSTLLKQGAVSQTTLDEADLTLKNAEGAVVTAEQDVASARAALGGNPDIEVDRHPSVMAALSRLDAAMLDLERTKVMAPADGMVTQTTSLRPGQYVSTNASVVTLVETGTTVIEANFKETELTHMKAGQPVEVTVDAYPDVTIKGVVESIGAGTGSAFSLIPAQNGSGNWVKVVQRVPVRIQLELNDESPALRVGMSALASVDTGHARGLPNFVKGGLAMIGFGNTALASEGQQQ